MSESINFWAVLVAAISTLVVGGLWYGPLFGKAWMKMMETTPEEMKAKGRMLAPTQAMSIALVSSFVMAYVLSHFADVWGALDGKGAWALAFWVWLGFIATTQLSAVLWEGRAWKLWAFNAIQSLVSIYSMTLILVFWR